jgi:hypothetical protein
VSPTGLTKPRAVCGPITADFKTATNDAVNCTDEVRLASARTLGDLIIQQSPLLNRFTEFLNAGRTHGQETIDLFTSILLYDIEEGSLGESFFLSLRDLHNRCNPEPERWPHELAYLTECTFLRLLRFKYDGAVVNFYQERIPTITNGAVSISTVGKPFDAIAWLELEDCGEFLEAKKQVETIVDSAAKLRAISKFASELRALAPKSSFVAVATLYPNSLERARTLFESILDDQFAADIITGENLGQWLTNCLPV